MDNSIFENRIEQTLDFKSPKSASPQEEEFQTVNKRRKGSFLDYLEKSNSSKVID
jgi:hypothetical protein